MAIERRFCVNHPQRPAIGVCVITGRALCGECSTRYEGVNYSKEGLEILHRRNAAAQQGRNNGWLVLAWILSPGLLYLLYLSYSIAAGLLIAMLHRDL